MLFFFWLHELSPPEICLKIFLSTSRENGPCRFKLITSSKIFVYIYEVFSIALRSCLYCTIEEHQFPKRKHTVKPVVQFVF